MGTTRAKTLEHEDVPLGVFRANIPDTYRRGLKFPVAAKEPFCWSTL